MTIDLSGDKHFGHAVTISIEALKALLLVNGGAATALIALKAKGGGSFVLPVLFFGLAALLNASTLTLGYFSQLNYANSRFQEESGSPDEATTSWRSHIRWQAFAIIVLMISLAASAGGMVTAFRQIDSTACGLS